MSRKKKQKQDPAAAPGAVATQDTSNPIDETPACAESTSDACEAGPSEEKSGDAGSNPETAGGEPLPPAPGHKVWTMDEIREEYFPGKKRFSGGVAAGLQRELRRRNREAEKGY